MNKNYYKILGISNDASQPEIKKSYFAKAKMYHPDVCKDKDAEEKFKEISMAYETLNDVTLRKKYDEHMNSPDNSRNYNNSRTYEKDFSILNRMFSIKEKDYLYFHTFLKNNFETEKEIASAYAYFWLSFWSGGNGTIEMLRNKNTTKIFKAFCSNHFIKKMKKSLIQEVQSDNEKRQFVNHLKTSLKKIYESVLEPGKNSQESFNWMIKLINEDNVFDDENTMYYFLLVSNDVFNVLTKFEEIFDKSSSIRTKSHYSNGVKVKGGMSIIIPVIIIIIILFIFLK